MSEESKASTSVEDVVKAARDFRKIMKGTMALLGPTGIRFCAAVDKYEVELNQETTNNGLRQPK